MSSKNNWRGLSPLLIVIAILSLALPALAFQPVNQNDNYEILLPAFAYLDAGGYQRDVGKMSVEGELVARYGGLWRVQSWNPRSETPHWVYGTPVRFANSIASSTALESIARSVIAENAALLGAENIDLALSKTPNALGKWGAHFQQTYHGIEVWQAQIRLIFGDNGELMLMGSDVYSDITVDPNPTLPAKQAEEIARFALPWNPATDRMETAPELLVLPYPVSPTAVNHHLVWRLKLRTEDPLGAWVTHVDAHSGEILWRYNDIHFAYSGDTDTEVQPITWCDGSVQETDPYLEVEVDGLGTVTTDASGDWSIAGTGGDRDVTSILRGPFIYVDYNNMGPEAAFFGTAQENVPFTVTWDDGNSQQDERDVFDSINDCHDFFELFDPGFAYSNTQIRGRVSINAGCNAFWDGSINFYRELGNCANTGEIQGVAHHEFGHGVQSHIIGGQGGEGLGEGNGDILANFITQESIIGRGFNLDNCTGGIRNSLNNLIYPDHAVGTEIHFAGQVIAGFNWDNMLLFQDLYGTEQGMIESATLWHFGRILMDPEVQPDQVLSAFIVDDDDNDLTNGTPHHAILCEAAANHNFDCPEILFGVVFNHTELGDTMDDDTSRPVEVTVYSTEAPIDPSTVSLNYRWNDGSWNPLAMTSGGGDGYSAEIPALPFGKVDYFFYAEDTSGLTGTEPVGAPGAFHSYLVAWMIDDLESSSNWTVGAPGDDATDGIWERGNPHGTIAQPEDDHTADGNFCWFTGQNSIVGPPGPGSVNGRTTVTTDVIDLSGATDVHVRYWKWFSANRGSGQGGDSWEVYVSNDGGGSWETIEFTDESTNAWVSVLFALDDYFPFEDPSYFRLRFTAEEADPPSLVEAAVDDMTIQAYFATGVGDDGLVVSPVASMDQNYPNPFNPQTAISFSIPVEGVVDLGVFDARGRRLITLAEGELPAGEHTVVWDGNDAQGKPVAAGVYFYQLDAAGERSTKRMVLIK